MLITCKQCYVRAKTGDQEQHKRHRIHHVFLKTPRYVYASLNHLH